MIVCDLGDRWQIVMQTDHADLSGEFARRWTERTPRSDSLQVAAERHDDGWAVWEQAPMYDVQSGKPLNFLDVGVLAHLAFYRAGIAAITEQDPYAGLLVSMHGAGIYQGRYGLQPELRLTFAGEVREQVDAFVAEQESSFDARERELGVTTEERMDDYALLQVYDRMSLLFCMNDTLSPPAGEVMGYRFEPAGEGIVTMSPFGFDGDEQQFSLLRRVVPRQAWSDSEAFRRELFDAAPEETSITIRAGSAG
jgi:Protein of unknown function (DUF3891)